MLWIREAYCFTLNHLNSVYSLLKFKFTVINVVVFSVYWNFQFKWWINHTLKVKLFLWNLRIVCTYYLKMGFSSTSLIKFSSTLFDQMYRTQHFPWVVYLSYKTVISTLTFKKTLKVEKCEVKVSRRLHRPETINHLWTAASPNCHNKSLRSAWRHLDFFPFFNTAFVGEEKLKLFPFLFQETDGLPFVSIWKYKQLYNNLSHLQSHYHNTIRNWKPLASSSLVGLSKSKLN